MTSVNVFVVTFVAKISLKDVAIRSVPVWSSEAEAA